MIEIFTRKDLEKAIDEYVKLREITGLGRDTSKFGALKTVVEHAGLRQAIAEDTERLSKAQTDKLPPLEMKQ